MQGCTNRERSLQAGTVCRISPSLRERLPEPGGRVLLHLRYRGGQWRYGRVFDRDDRPVARDYHIDRPPLAPLVCELGYEVNMP